MAIPAIIIKDDRSAKRFAVELDATIRVTSARPYDVMIEDLSATGFRMAGGPVMQVGDSVSIGFSGIGVQPARLTRVHEDRYGCEFLQPLSPNDLATALDTAPVAPIAFPTLLTQAWLADAPEPHVEPYSLQIRLALAFAMPIALWAIIAGVYWVS